MAYNIFGSTAGRADSVIQIYRLAGCYHTCDIRNLNVCSFSRAPSCAIINPGTSLRENGVDGTLFPHLPVEFGRTTIYIYPVVARNKFTFLPVPGDGTFYHKCFAIRVHHYVTWLKILIVANLIIRRIIRLPNLLDIQNFAHGSTYHKKEFDVHFFLPLATTLYGHALFPVKDRQEIGHVK